MTVADFPDYAAPQAHADAINTTGVPLLRNIVVLGDTTVINAGTTSGVFSQSYGNFYEGYLIEVIPQNPGARVFAADVVISHVDASGNTVAIEQVTVSNYQNLGNNTSLIRGKLLGSTIKVQAQVAASSWFTGVVGAGLTADNIKIRFCALQTFLPGTGKRVPIITASGGLLIPSSVAVTLGTVAGVATLLGVLPDYTGEVVVSCSTTGGGGFACNARIASYTVSNGTGALSVADFPLVQIKAPSYTTFALPSCFNVAYIVQQSTVAVTQGIAIGITAPDQ